MAMKLFRSLSRWLRKPTGGLCHAPESARPLKTKQISFGLHKSLPAYLSQLFNRYRVIGIDAHLTGNLHGFFRDLSGGERGMLRQRLRGGLRIGSTAANGGDAGVRLNYVSLTAEQIRLLLVANQQQGFQMPQKLVGAPIFCQLHCGTTQVAVILLQLRFKAAEKRERI